jgi:hypothetical protein
VTPEARDSSEPRPEGSAEEQPEQPEQPEQADTDAGSEEDRRRRRRAEVFGDVLPDSTGDDRPDRWGEGEPGDATEEWLRRQVPPHHG